MSGKTLPDALKRRNSELKQLTRECLTEALFSLMKEYDFEQITVTRLCEKAGVSRNTFYKTFGSVRDVFRGSVMRFNRDIIFRRLGNPFGKTCQKQWYEDYFNIIAQYADMLRVVMNSDVALYYMQQVNALMVSPKQDAETRYARYMWSGAIQNITMEWLSSGMLQSPEQMAEICVKIGLSCK